MNSKKLNILLSCLFYSDLTGSEIYVFELAKNLKGLGHNVSVLTTRKGGIITSKSEELGINVYDFYSPPGYLFCNSNGYIIHNGKKINGKPNSYVKITNVNFDVIHSQHKPVTQTVLNLYPRIPKICTIHSEIIDVENPILHEDIKKYIAIRPEIKDHLVKNFSINKKKIEVIYNPFDFNKFNILETSDQGYLLFVGTIHDLRKQTLFDLVEYSKKNNMDFMIVGEDHSNFLQLILQNNHVKYFKSRYDIENVVKNCRETAGILLGRTTIEGWLCGKPGWIYDVDSNGNILNKSFQFPPDDIDKFNSVKITSQILDQYLKII